jgi:pSer/pThr/pTyr-binding forkhead associated (FHA) protein
LSTQDEGRPGPSWVFWVEGPRRRARLVLRGSFFVVGRLEPFAVFQDDPMISRDHAAIVAVEGGVRVRDLGSRNGVLLNGKRLERYAEVDLPPGAVLHVGQTAIRLLREGERPEATTERTAEDDVTVDEEGQTKGRLAAVDADAASLAGSSSDDLGEVTGELDVPELAGQVDEAEVEAVAAAVRDAARSAADEDVLETRRIDGSERPAGEAAIGAADRPAPAEPTAEPPAGVEQADDPPRDALDDDLEEVPDETPAEPPREAQSDAIDRLFE